MKISIIGAGNVGATTALYILEERLTDELMVIDVVEGLAPGKMLDLAEAAALRGYRGKIMGSNDFSHTSNSDIIVITAGVARKPGMSRLDLLKTNQQIVKSVCLKIKELAPNSIVLVVTNPLDIMCYVALKTTEFEKSKVLGMAGVLDAARFRYFAGDKTGTPPSSVQAMVLGGHGDEMVPLKSMGSISGVPLNEFLTEEETEIIIKRTQNAGAEIVRYLKTGSAFYAPAASVVEMLRAMVQDENKVLPASAYLEGEYGFTDVYCGVPVRLGRCGIKEIMEIELSKEEKEALNKSVAVVKNAIEQLVCSSTL